MPCMFSPPLSGKQEGFCYGAADDRCPRGRSWLADLWRRADVVLARPGRMSSPSRLRFRPPSRPTFRFRVQPPGLASLYSRSVLGADENLEKGIVLVKGLECGGSQSAQILCAATGQVESRDQVRARLRRWWA